MHNSKEMRGEGRDSPSERKNDAYHVETRLEQIASR